MPKCELTGIQQIAVQKCLHPKYEGKYIGYMTCKQGLKKEGIAFVCKGACPNFIQGSGTEDVWCRLWKEYKENERIDREIEKIRRKGQGKGMYSGIDRADA